MISSAAAKQCYLRPSFKSEVICGNKNPNKKEFHAALRTLLPAYHDVAVRYTGQLIKNPEIPLLWQISNTNATEN